MRTVRAPVRGVGTSGPEALVACRSTDQWADSRSPGVNDSTTWFTRSSYSAFWAMG